MFVLTVLQPEMKRGNNMLGKKLIIGVASLALTLAACGSNSASSAPDALEPSTAPTGSITVWSWDVAATALTRLAAEYQAANPGTTIEVVDVGYDNAYDKISVGLKSGSGLPDLVTVETDRMPGYISNFPDGFVDLSSAANSMKADFDPSKWDASSNSDGALLSLPWDSGTVAMYYRSDYWQEAGIDPSSINTWDDFIAAGETIKAKTGHTSLSFDVSSGALFQMLLQQQGGSYFDEAGNINLHTPEAIRALTLMKTMQDKGLVDNVDGWDGRVSASKEGHSASHVEAVWWIGTLTGEMPELTGKFGVRPLPVFEDGGAQTANNGGSTLAIPAQSVNQPLAWSFAKFVLANTNNQVSMMQNEGLYPAYLPALTDTYFQSEDPYFGGQKVYQTFAELTGKIPTLLYTSDYGKASEAVAAAVVASVLNGADPATALKDAETQIASATGRTIAP